MQPIIIQGVCAATYHSLLLTSDNNVNSGPEVKSTTYQKCYFAQFLYLFNRITVALYNFVVKKNRNAQGRVEYAVQPDDRTK